MRGKERFLYSPILSCTHSSWIKKIIPKTIDYLRDYGFVLQLYRFGKIFQSSKPIRVAHAVDIHISSSFYWGQSFMTGMTFHPHSAVDKNSLN